MLRDLQAADLLNRHLPPKKMAKSDGLQPILLANLVTTSKALVTRSDALVPSSFLLLLVRHLLLEAMHLFLVASCYY